MAKDIVDRCEGCQFYSDMSHKPASALKIIPLIWPFAVWGLNMVGPLRTGRSGFTHVLVAVDKFTKWIEAKPIKNHEASTAVSFIRDITFRLLGNIVLSKNFKRTHKIMAMHSNERGECCLRTLVDRQRKR